MLISKGPSDIQSCLLLLPPLWPKANWWVACYIRSFPACCATLGCHTAAGQGTQEAGPDSETEDSFQWDLTMKA